MLSSEKGKFAILTLGSLEKDASYIKSVKDNLKIHIQINRNKDFYNNFLPQKLRWFLKDIVAHSPFYRDSRYRFFLLSKNPEQNFSKIPLLEKVQLQRMSKVFCLGKEEGAYFKVRTSGSTGVPLEMWFYHEYFVSYYSRFCYFLQSNNIWPSNFSVSMTNLSIFKKAIDDYWILQPSVNYSFYHRINIHGAKWESPSEVVQAILMENPLILRGMPTTLELLADYIKNYPRHQPIRPKLIITMSETLLPQTREKLEMIFDAPVYDEYGLTEVGGIVAQECVKQTGFHINTMDYYVEIVDPAGKQVQDGTEGEIVITNLYHKIVPLLRYRTGDYGAINCEPCTCGSIAPRLIKLAGRSISRFTLPSGLSYNPFDKYKEYLLELPINQFQMVQEKGYKIILSYTGNQDISDHPQILALHTRVRELYDGKAYFKLRKVKRFTYDGKFQAFLYLE